MTNIKETVTKNGPKRERTRMNDNSAENSAQAAIIKILEDNGYEMNYKFSQRRENYDVLLNRDTRQMVAVSEGQIIFYREGKRHTDLLTLLALTGGQTKEKQCST